ncbi:alpha/beta hydrolase family protein [Chryseobacterium sp. G0201]|uniref:alpha/beta hydrolase family protein n=1 Tax=Chryseobacterium sp. G0201 TaxID=2487065 RepID=UPI000F515DD3|nr:prolyl oligopeptidase family serine peptidase [Chryseobacterium sp. G0201]AZA54526.1 S9 family peptidase [Chryseobacterium sp. G0201]
MKATRSCIALFTYLVFAQLLSGQNSQWYQVFNKSVTKNGNWIYFVKHYDDGEQEGVLQNGATLKTTIFRNPGEVYLDDKILILRNKDNTVFIRNLKKQEEFQFQQISGFTHDSDTSNTILTTTAKEISVVDNSGLVRYKTANVEKLTITNGNLWIRKKNVVSLLNLKTLKEKILVDNFQRWSVLKEEVSIDEKLVKQVLTRDSITIARFYDFEGHLQLEKELPAAFAAYSRYNFFDSGYLSASKQPFKNVKNSDSIEVWSSEDKGIKPKIMKNKIEGYTDLIFDVNTSAKYENPPIFGATRSSLIFDNKVFLDFYDLENDDFTEEIASPTFRLRDLKTGETIFTAQHISGQYFHVSKKFNQLFYFKNKDWWMYDYDKRKEVNLTAGLSTNFYQFNRLNEKVSIAISRLFLSHDNKKVFLTDENDIWEYDLVINKAIRLTHSIDSHISYRILNNSINEPVERLKWTNFNEIGENFLLLDISKDDGSMQGLAVYKDQKIDVIESLGANTISQLVYAENMVTYVTENGNEPYVLKLYNINSKKKRTTYYSNKENFEPSLFPSTKVHFWKNKDGESDYCGVILPPDYDASKKYPMIVRIYENEAKGYKDFVYPSYYGQNGFNRSLSAMNGYIILLPRIVYKKDEPGQSALSCVETAIKTAASFYNIDLNRIGIIGHSFGGFEVNYLVCHSNIFKAAISGASLSDITASYFSLNQNWLRPEIYRYTDQSFRFSGSFYDIKEVYYENNPIFHAEKINTPLLLWAGKEDYHVNWNQSVAMFIAMKSLKKDSKLLLFPSEGHAIVRKEHQKEATKRFMQWFDYYLKGSMRPSWF